MASSATIYVKAQIMQMTQSLAPVSTIIPFSFKIIPYLVIWLLFTFIYIVIPNTKVRVPSAISGGIVAGTIFGIVQWAYITFQMGASKYGAIYGSFAALPLFLIWLQLSWIIVLFGSEVCFAYQNVKRYAFEIDVASAKPRFKKLVALRITQLCVRNFCDGGIPHTAVGISNILEIPLRLVNQTLFELVKCRILSETTENEDGEPGFQPARDVNLLSINFVIQTLEELGNKDISIHETQEMNTISECLNEFAAILDRSETNLLLKDI
jgi:membrane protein